MKVTVTQDLIVIKINKDDAKDLVESLNMAENEGVCPDTSINLRSILEDLIRRR